MKKLFLDDIRTVDMVYNASMESEFDVVRSFAAFVRYIEKNGLPSSISFDNDLGLDENGEVAPDGYAAAKWLVYESGLNLMKLNYHVHSANPVATEQIKGLLTNYQNHIRSEGFASEVEEYCSTIDWSNFSQKYDGLIQIVRNYNDMGLSRSKIVELLNVSCGLYADADNEPAEEVVSQILNQITGYCPPYRDINLKE